jgi:hypothetical protein
VSETDYLDLFRDRYWYILAEDGETPVHVGWEPYVRWQQDHNPTNAPMRVGDTYVGDVEVSTVFLCHDHNWWGGPPILWETKIFGGQYDQHQWRYHTQAEAIAKHDQIVASLRDGREP